MASATLGRARRILGFAMSVAIVAGVTSAGHPFGPASAHSAVAPRLAVSPKGSDTGDSRRRVPARRWHGLSLSRVRATSSPSREAKYPGERVTGLTRRNGHLRKRRRRRRCCSPVASSWLPCPYVVVRGLGGLSHAAPAGRRRRGALCSSQCEGRGRHWRKSFAIFEGFGGCDDQRGARTADTTFPASKKTRPRGVTGPASCNGSFYRLRGTSSSTAST